MYLVDSYEGDRAKTMARCFGPNFDSTCVERIEVWGTSFKDPGPDYCEFRAYDKDGHIVKTGRMAGY